MEARLLPRPLPGPCEVRLDRGADGVVDERRVSTWSRDGAPRLLAVETVGPDGRPISRDTYTRDAAGRVLSLVHTVTSPAPAETTSTFRYDEAGRLLSSETLAGGGPARTVTWELDAQGRVLRRLAGELVERFEYDAQGRHVRSEVTERGALVQVLTRTFGDTGQLASVQMDLGGDGATDAVTAYEYDLRGRLATLTTIGPGRMHAVSRHAYDEAGNFTETVHRDGAVADRMTYDYTCWSAP